jgi:hypothetical protein
MRTEDKTNTERLARRIPGFAGYRAVHASGADWLLRRFLSAEVEKVRDRLAELIAGGEFSPELKDKMGLSLRAVAFLKDELTPGRREERREEEPLRPAEEERLLDLDIALDEKIAALHAPLDAMESATDPEGLNLALAVFDEGLAEVDDLFRMRSMVFRREK